MELISFYKMLRGASSYSNLRSQGSRLSGSVATKSEEENNLARSAPPVQCVGNEDYLSRLEHNQHRLVKTSSSLLNVEKNLLPSYVVNYYLEDAILRRFSEHNNMSTKSETSLVDLLQATSLKPEYSSSTTAVEYKQMMHELAKMEKTSPTPRAAAPVSRINTDDKEVKKGGLLPFVTKLPTFRQQGVPPQAGFASTAEKTSGTLLNEMETSPVIKDTTTKLGKDIGNKAEETPFVEGSVQDGSFTKVTRVNIFHDDRNAIGLASMAGDAASGKQDAILKADGKMDAALKAASRELASAQEFLKYQTPCQTVTPTEALDPMADRRAEAEMKACAVVTQKGSLRDAQTLIEFNKSRFAPRSLMNLKECVEYQYNDHKTLALLQKYRTLKLREIDYHHAQIKKHRKLLLELMFKTPYQKPQDPSKPP